MSKIFKCILNEVYTQKVIEPFNTNNVKDCLNSSKSFLAKHSTDKNKPNKKVYGKPYFVRISRGKYKINEKYKICL